MARMTYNTQTPFGQLISEAVDRIQTATLSVGRSASAISAMNAEQCEAEIGVPQSDFTQFRNRLNDIRATLEDEKFRELLVLFDQG